MGEYLSPGVYVEEMAGPRPIEGASTSTAAFVGYTAKGEPGKPKFITSFGDYQRHFGGFRKDDAFTPFAVKNFFDEGGSKAYVVRHMGANGAAATGTAGTNFTVSAKEAGEAANTYGIVAHKGVSDHDGKFSIRVFTGMEALNPSPVPIAEMRSITMKDLKESSETILANAIKLNADGTVSMTGTEIDLFPLNDLLEISNVGSSMSVATLPEAGATLTAKIEPLVNGFKDEGTDAVPATVTLDDSSDNAVLEITTVGYETAMATYYVTVSEIDTNTRSIDIFDGSGNPIASSGNITTATLISEINTQLKGSNTDSMFIVSSSINEDSLTNLPKEVLADAVKFNVTASDGTPSVEIPADPSNDVIASAIVGETSAFSATATSKGSWGNKVTVAVTSSGLIDEKKSQLFTVSVLYDGTEVESFEDVTLDSRNPKAFIETVINDKSDYIDISLLDSSKEVTLGYFSLSNGSDDSKEAADTPPELDQAKLKEYLKDLDSISMLVTPDLLTTTEQAAGANYCDSRGDCFYIASSNKKVPSELRTERTNLGGKSRCALYAPYIKVSHPSTGAAFPIPAAGAVAGIYARTDKNRGVFKAPAGTTDGQVRSALGLDHLFVKADQDMLNPFGINVIRNLSGIGNVIWGARTTAADAQWRYVPVRRLVTYIEKSIENSIQWAVFEPNSHELWSQLKREISGFLRGIWSVGGLFGKTEDEAFFVKIDEENNPQSSRDAGKLIVNIGVATVKPAEFVIIRIEQTQSDA